MKEWNCTLRKLPACTLVSLFSLVTAGPLPAVEDTAPPRLVSISFSPTTVDISGSNQAITVTARITDNLSGMVARAVDESSRAAVSGWFTSPSQNQGRAVDFDLSMRESGDELDGVYVSNMLVPQSSEAGIWTLMEFSAADALGNRQQLELAELLARGFPLQFRVVPALTIRNSGGAVSLSWPASAAGFVLQSKASLSESAPWHDFPEPLITSGACLVVTVPAASGQMFYRLRRDESELQE